MQLALLETVPPSSSIDFCHYLFWRVWNNASFVLNELVPVTCFEGFETVPTSSSMNSCHYLFWRVWNNTSFVLNELVPVTCFEGFETVLPSSSMNVCQLLVLKGLKQCLLRPQSTCAITCFDGFETVPPSSSINVCHYLFWRVWNSTSFVLNERLPLPVLKGLKHCLLRPQWTFAITCFEGFETIPPSSSMNVCHYSFWRVCSESTCPWFCSYALTSEA